MIGEIPTYEQILQRCLDRIPNTLDKRQGSIIYDAIAPICAELAQMYIEVEATLDLVFIDTTVGDTLDRKAEELGLTRNVATYATRKATFNMAVSIGSRFSIQNVTYKAVSFISGFSYRLECEQTGIIGNEYYGSLTPVSYIQGLTSALLQDILIPGEDVETDDALRQRYIDYVSQPAFGGNMSDYKIKTKALDGVGGVKVFPVWNGGGTVKLVITDSTFEVPASELVTSVQEEIDPDPQGTGIGIAPIGHTVTVNGVTSVTVPITTTIVLKSGYILSEVADQIEIAMEDYLSSLREDWENLETVTIRLSQIDTRTLAVLGVEDVTATLINGVATNLTLNETEIPVLGSVIVNEAV